MADQDMVYNEPQKLSANQYSCVGGTFTGWNTKPDGSGQGFEDMALIDQDNRDLLFPTGAGDNGKTINLYAQWDMDVYDITYDLANGKLPADKTNPATYTAADSFTLINPDREGYDFTGWTGTGITSPQMEVTVPKDSTGNRTYTATWSVIPDTVLMAWGVPAGKKAVTTKWTKVAGAAKYNVYAGSSVKTLKLVKTVKGNSLKIKKISKKKLRKHKCYTFRVTALDQGGKVIAVSKPFSVNMGLQVSTFLTA